MDRSGRRVTWTFPKGDALTRCLPPGVVPGVGSWDDVAVLAAGSICRSLIAPWCRISQYFIASPMPATYCPAGQEMT